MSDLSSQHEDILEEGGLQKHQDELLATTRELLDDQDLITLRLILNNQHESDLADLIAQLPEEDQSPAFGLIAAPLAASTLSEIETPTLLTLLEHLEDRISNPDTGYDVDQEAEQYAHHTGDAQFSQNDPECTACLNMPYRHITHCNG